MNLKNLKGKFSNYGAFAKNSAILFVGTMLANVLNYAYHLVIGRQVSVEIYGEAESLISLMMIVSVPAASLVMVATKYAAACKASGDNNGSREIWNYLNRQVFKFGLPIFLLAILATPLIGKFLNIKNNLALVAIWIVMYVSFFNSINTGLLNGWQKFKKVSFATIFSTAAKFVSGIVLVSAGFALGGIVGSLVLSSFAGYFLTLALLKFRVIKKTVSGEQQLETKVDFNALKKFIMPVFVGNLAITILGNADMILAKHNLNALEAGQYGALTVVSKIIFFGTGIVAGVLFSMSAENSHKKESSHHILKTALVLVIAASSLATLIYFAYPVLILSFLFGDKYQQAAPYLGWFAIAVALFSISNVIFQYLLSIHKTKIVYTLIIFAISSIIIVSLFGKTTSSIIAIVIAAQVFSIFTEMYHLKKL